MSHPLTTRERFVASPKRVLVVNDDPMQLELMAATVREMGHEVVTAVDGEDAIHRAQGSDDFDLIVTDLYMPNIDGWKLCRLLRSTHFPRFNRVPILVQSATFSGSDTEQVTLDNGANHFLPFPYPVEELRNSVAKLLAGEIPQKPTTALVVNANDTLRRLVADAMRGAGYAVEEAAGAERGRALARRRRPDLVILGFPLPDADAEDLVDEFKAVEIGATVIVVADHPPDSLAVRVTRRGADAFVREPFEIAYLLELCDKTRRERALIRIEELLEDRSRELTNSERKYRDLIENAVDIIFMIDADGVIIEVNEAFLAVSGYTGKELVGSHFALLLHTADVDQSRAALHKAARGDSSTFELRIKNKAGGFSWYSFSYRPVTDPEGAVLAIHAIGRDINEQKDAAERLEWMGRIVEQVGEGIAVLDLEGNIAFANQAFVRMHGAEGALQIVSHAVSEFVEPQGSQLEIIPFRAGVLRVGRHTGETTHRRLDGSVFDALVTTTIFTDADHRRAGYILFVQDLTERKAAARALSESETRYEIVANRTSDIIITRTIAERSDTRFLCGRCEAITGYKESELEGDAVRWIERVPSEDRRRIDPGGGVRPFDGPPGNFEVVYRFITKDGRVIHLREEGVRQHDAVTGVTRVYASVRDISAQVQAEEDRERLQSQLLRAQKMESIGTLAGGIAHDFNNLLTGVMGNQELASLYVSGEGQSYLNNAKVAAQRAADLVKKLLAFSRKEKLEREVVDLTAIVQETHKMLAETIDRRIHIAWEAGEGLWPVNADSGQVHQVLMNLCINARDAIMDVLEGRTSMSERPEHFSILIHLENAMLRETDIVTRHDAKPGPHVVLRVTDNGCGMDEETQRRLFEPFFTTKEAGRGTGLGLATVFGVVRQHEGWIEFDSRPGQGTSFRIYLPAASNATRSMVPSASGEEIGPLRGQETILVVDDEAFIRDILVHTLRPAGYSIILARDGREGVELFIEHRHQIAAVILDLTMPRMSGREVLEQIHEKAPGAKIIISSGHADLIDRKEYVRMGAAAFVPKPYKPVELLKTLRSVLDS